MMFKSLNGLAQSICMSYSVSDIQTITCVIPSISSTYPSRVRDYLRRSFCYSGALLWNSLPESIGAIRSIEQEGRRKSITHFKPSIPTRQSCKSVFFL